jgi:hypothetical protein
MQDPEAAALALDALAQLGVRIAVDDFGTGYSSLLYVRQYPISAIKLDRAFVSGIGVSPEDEAICGSVVSLAHAVGATSIGEGVETLEQYAALRAFGCQQAQGYLWSPAIPVTELAEVLLACGDVPKPPPVRAPASAERQRSAVITRAVAVAADKTAEAAETARVTKAVAVALAAEAVALTAAETATAVQLQAEASATKVADAASEAASALAATLSGGDAAAAVTAFRLAATVSAAAVANAEETALAAAIVARAVAAAASQAALTASAAATALENEVSNAAAAVRAVVAETAGPAPASDPDAST